MKERDVQLPPDRLKPPLEKVEDQKNLSVEMQRRLKGLSAKIGPSRKPKGSE